MADEEKDNIIVRLTLDFAVNIVNYTEMLEESKKFVIARQLLKSGTSIGANIKEAQNAESPADFLHKIKIAAKEVEETEYWLEICSRIGSYPKCDDLKSRLTHIRNVIGKIIITCKSK